MTSSLVEVYMQKLEYWGVHICGCVGRGLEVVPCWWSLYMCVGFFLWRRSCVFILSSCWRWDKLLLSLFWCDCSALFPGAPAVFRCVSCSWLPFSGSTPCWLRLAAILLWWTFSLGFGVSWYRCPDTPLGFLPCAGATPASASSPLGFCTLGGCVSTSVSSLLVYSWGWVGGVFATSLGFLPCAMLILRACSLRSLPSCRLPWGFSGHRVSVLQLPLWRGLGFSPSLLFLGFSCSACLLG